MTVTPQKPDKPYPLFPLFAHANGSWAKKVNGKLKWFGSWRDDRDGKAALARYEEWIATPSSIQAKVEPSRPSSKPTKPYAGFPLYIHGGERWAKKILGKPHYFGPVAGDEKGEAALVKWLAQKDDLLAGRKPRPIQVVGGATVADVCNSFLAFQKSRADRGEISKRQFDDLFSVCKLTTQEFGRLRPVSDLRPEDFRAFKDTLAKTRKYHALHGTMQKVRSVFKYGYDSDLLDRPVKFGPGFQLPAKVMLRRERAGKPKRYFEAEQLRRIIAAAPVTLKAMVWLAINGGFGNSDCGHLEFDHINLETGWYDHIRVKTGALRRFPLWPETVEALRAAIAVRPKPEREEDECFVFITRLGKPWERDDSSRPLSNEFRELLDELKIYRKGLSFYTIRHNFQTEADNARDQVATRLIMGHADQSIADFYREHTRDERLQAVTDSVRNWLLRQTEERRAG